MSSISAVINIIKTIGSNIYKTTAKNGISKTSAIGIKNTILAGVKWLARGNIGLTLLATEIGLILYTIYKIIF